MKKIAFSLLFSPIRGFLERNELKLYFTGIPKATISVYNANTTSVLIHEILSNPDSWTTEIPIEENNEYLIEIQVGSQVYIGEFDV